MLMFRRFEKMSKDLKGGRGGAILPISRNYPQSISGAINVLKM